MDDADEIWNRATRGGGDSPREGDMALSAALAFHGLAMNGGVLHAFEGLAEEELGRARDGFAWLALPDVALFLDDTARRIADTDLDDDDAAEALEQAADDTYDELLPSDRALEDTFRGRFVAQPEAFNPA